MADSPNRRPNPDRPLDNEPPPLLTYGDDEPEAFDTPDRSRRRIPILVLLLVALVLGGGAYFLVIARGGLQLATGGATTPDGPVTQLPTVGGEALLRALVPTDTAAAPGTSVELSVRATAASGSMLSDARVRFAIDRGAGTLLSNEVWTDPGGVARTELQLPNRPATVVVRATLEGPEAPSTHFTVTTRTGAAAAMTAVQGNGQEQDAGGLLPDRLGVLVTDEQGLPVSGVEVRFQVGQGGGISAPSVTRTDSLGQASAVWRLGPAAGQQTLIATSPGLPGSLTFTATASGAALVPGAAAAADDPAVPSTTTTTPSAPISVAARNFVVGGSNVCFLAGTRVTCRGANDRGQGIADGAPGARSLAAGLFHACAIDGDGVASCWGANDAGQLGDGSRNDRASAVRVQTDLRFSALAAGVAHTCGLTTEGRTACWGQNLGGQLGDGSRDDRTTPGLVSGNLSFVDLVAGWNHTCGVTSGGALHCWGLNREGAVGDGSQLDRLQPQRITGSVTSVTAGSAHTCAVSGERALCWGDNRNGQLGDGSTQSRTRPTPVSELPGQPTSVAAGAAHSCALLADGTAHCWGQNLHGQLGNGSTAMSTSPSPVAGAHIFTRLAAGGGVTCGLGSGGSQHCWGLNQSGQIGDGTFTNRLTPTRVGGG